MMVWGVQWLFGTVFRGKGGPPLLEELAQHLPLQGWGFIRPPLCPTNSAAYQLGNTSPRNKAKNILNISRSHLTRLISIITGFNCLSYIQFKANPTINPLCRLCGEENETFWHFVTECPRLQSYRTETFLDTPPQQDNWRLNILCNLAHIQLYILI